MKLKSAVSMLLFALSFSANAQTFHNIYADATNIRSMCDSSGKLSSHNYYLCYKVLKNYLPTYIGYGYDSLAMYFEDNPFGLSPGNFLPPPGTHIQVMVGAGMPSSLFSGGSTGASSGFNVSSAAGALTQLIIERGKEELTATFFEQMKKLLASNQELALAFPKTKQFISQIEPYMYASYLSTLREAFAQDINNLPFQLGAILSTPRMELYLDKSKAATDLPEVKPVLVFIGDLHNGKKMIDAVKGFYPGRELEHINYNYYATLKLAVILSESLRDGSGKTDWISAAQFKALMADAVSRKIFFGLLYAAAMQDERPMFSKMNEVVTPGNVGKLTAVLQDFAGGYKTIKIVYDSVKLMARQGKALKFSQLNGLVDSSASALKQTFDTLAFIAAGKQVNTDVFFKPLTGIATVLGNFNDKKYAAGIMNTLLLVDSYFKNPEPIWPLEDMEVFTGENLTAYNLHASINIAIDSLQAYAKNNPDDKVSKQLKALENFKAQIKNDTSAARVGQGAKLLDSIQNHTFIFEADNTYQKLLKYGSLMASLSEAQTTADVTAALDAAILPVGSSSIKYYTAFSFALNSYIGASYYRAYYNTPQSGKLYLNTAGVALPIGVNVSATTRWPEIGAVSLFISAIDLGAVASYRLSAPQNVSSQTLPDFTLQNLLAPGAFIVLNRLFQTPLAIGFGAQKAPQLSSITDGTANISQSQTWRFGAFISVDIPLFNLYSKALKKPVSDQ